jgi:DNA-binding CsgD family transcriptional regulator
VIIGTDEGFVHYNPSFQSTENFNKNFNALIRKVELTSRVKDSTIFGGAFHTKKQVFLKQPSSQQLTLPYRFNSLRFNFSATSYEDINKVEYQYFLEGFDKNWSGWTSQIQKEYTNLYEGQYIFHVKAKNINGVESSEAMYAFVVSPPLGRSAWAYLLYVILAIGLAYLFKKLKDRSVAKANERLKIEQEKALRLKEAEHAEEVLKAEKEIIKLNNEKLANELLHKNKELSSTAMHVMQSMDTIQKIKDQIEEVVNTTNDKNVLNHLRKLLKAIESDIKFQSHWDQFELHFNQIHEDFLKRLRIEYPDLTHRDLKLCAYLRLNLSSKEMAHLLNLSIRGVETSRYRIRKKMNLDQEVNLTEFILKY